MIGYDGLCKSWTYEPTLCIYIGDILGIIANIRIHSWGNFFFVKRTSGEWSSDEQVWRRWASYTGPTFTSTCKLPGGQKGPSCINSSFFISYHLPGFLTVLSKFAFDLCAKIDGLHNSGRVDPDSFLPPGLPDLRQYPASQQEAMMKDARMEVLKAVLGWVVVQLSSPKNYLCWQCSFFVLEKICESVVFLSCLSSVGASHSMEMSTLLAWRAWAQLPGCRSVPPWNCRVSMRNDQHQPPTWSVSFLGSFC